jgi:predicted RNase H-like HicB family nuclease
MVKEILLHISLVKESDGGYTAHCPDLDVASQGETVEEAIKNIKEAVELYIESAQKLGILHEVQEKLGIKEFKDGMNFPSILKTEMAVKIAV